MEIFVLFVLAVFIFLVIHSVKQNPQKTNSHYHQTYSDSSSHFDDCCKDGWEMGHGGNDCGSSMDGGGGSDGGGGGGGD